jgi:SAM-dependent methyltransferase
MSVEEKYDRLAERWSEDAYADPDLFYRRRASLVRTVGPALEPGDRVLELGCADGGLSARLAEAGLEVHGIDVSPAMIERAQARVPRATFAVGDVNEIAPAAPVAATIGFRVLPYVDDLTAFFTRVASFSEKKILFDLIPSTGPSLEDVSRALSEAGLFDVEMRPWLLPARTPLPRALRPVVFALERTPLAKPIVKRRFSAIVAAAT